MYYLLDSENISLSVLVEKIHSEELEIEKNSTLVIFFNRSTHYAHTDMEAVEKIFKKVIIETLDIPTKDALDTYLIVYLGYISNSMKKKSFCIISNDKGYVGAIHALRKYKPRHTFSHITFNTQKASSKKKPYGKRRRPSKNPKSINQQAQKDQGNKANSQAKPTDKNTKKANPPKAKDTKKPTNTQKIDEKKAAPAPKVSKQRNDAYKTIHKIVNRTSKLQDKEEAYINQILDLYVSSETAEAFITNRIKLNQKFGLKLNSLNTLDNQYQKMQKLLK